MNALLTSYRAMVLILLAWLIYLNIEEQAELSCKATTSELYEVSRSVADMVSAIETTRCSVSSTASDIHDMKSDLAAMPKSDLSSEVGEIKEAVGDIQSSIEKIKDALFEIQTEVGPAVSNIETHLLNNP